MQYTAKRAARRNAHPHIITALMALSRLALRTSTLGVASQDSAQRWATLLLKQLLACYAAPQGAIFVAPYRSGGKLDRSYADLEPQDWSFFTSLHLSEEDARVALQMVASTQDTLQWSATAPDIIVWKRSLPSGHLDGNELENEFTQTLFSPLVVLLFLWPAAEQHESARALHQALHELPCLADLVDTILVHILTAHAEGKSLARVFPADLLATMGHELRGPLTTIQGYADTLLRYEQRLALAERQEFLRAIGQASTHMSTLVARFLELAQFETRTHAFFPTPVQMQALAQEAITAAQEHRSHCVLLLPPALPEPQASGEPADEIGGSALTIVGDRRLLRTMLDILLENALAYSAPASLVEVSFIPQVFSATAGWSPPAASDKPLALILPATFQDQEPLLEIRVCDHGRGIAPDELSAIFRRFYRVDTRLTREVNGLGLGLTLCQAIVAQHRGMLWVESVLGEGCTFHIVLPCRQALVNQSDEDGAQQVS